MASNPQNPLADVCRPSKRAQTIVLVEHDVPIAHLANDQATVRVTGIAKLQGRRVEDLPQRQGVQVAHGRHARAMARQPGAIKGPAGRTAQAVIPVDVQRHEGGGAGLPGLPGGGQQQGQGASDDGLDVQPQGLGEGGAGEQVEDGDHGGPGQADAAEAGAVAGPDEGEEVVERVGGAVGEEEELVVGVQQRGGLGGDAAAGAQEGGGGEPGAVAVRGEEEGGGRDEGGGVDFVAELGGEGEEGEGHCGLLSLFFSPLSRSLAFSGTTRHARDVARGGKPEIKKKKEKKSARRWPVSPSGGGEAVK
ncbi:hypothetical protein FGG08_001021 [Glutinoglossum americanum]|uniref:Uncharacterized protein n=1 Tax=Glutinoglossum americanum TaxID=1670608 RepID=A0A9P8IFE9_9PEZI|nr:hypothetical protein FGG08_001021 [Glutinoglossum americanum]